MNWWGKPAAQIEAERNRRDAARRLGRHYAEAVDRPPPWVTALRIVGMLAVTLFFNW